MLNKPKFMSPSINMYGNTVIDLNSTNLPFSCIVDGNEAIKGFQIVIRRLKDDKVVFDTTMRTLDTPFFPINNRNQNVVFSRDLKDYFDATSINNNFVNSSDAYYWTILFRSTSDFEVQSAAEVFYANSIPETIVYYYDEVSDKDIALSTDEKNISVLKTRKVYFKSSYNQSEGVSLKRYGWRLTDTTNKHIVMDTITQNQIYGIKDDISCVCNGLINQTNYLLELYIETQNGYFNILESIEFKIDYAIKNLEADFEIVPLNNTSGIMLNWGNLRTTEGYVSGVPVSYMQNTPLISYDNEGNPNGSTSVKIPINSMIVFEGTANGKDLKINEDSYIVVSFQFDKFQDYVVLFGIYGEDDNSNLISRELSYNASEKTLQYTVAKGDIVVYDKKQLSDVEGSRCWCIATLCPLIPGADIPAELKVVESVSSGWLFPSNAENPDLFPSDELYPGFVEWDKIREE